jgi:malate dehydrogenase (oxaloacetate-decarboxylating)(NADP+)
MTTGMEQINLKSTAIDKYSYLSNLRNTNAGLFYRLLIDHMKVRFIGFGYLGCSQR